MQKKRVFNKSIVLFNRWCELRRDSFFGNFAAFFNRNTIIKLKFVKKFKKRFRKPLRRKRLKLWFFCKPNYLVHQKFKNSRMGKGKGSPLLWVYNTNSVKPFAIFRGIHYMRAKSVVSFFKKHLSPHIYLRSV